MVTRNPVASRPAHVCGTARNAGRSHGILANPMTMCANAKLEEIRISGRTLYVPSAEICGRTVIVKGKWIRTAQVKDEEVVEGVTVENPDSFITKLKESRLQEIGRASCRERV